MPDMFRYTRLHDKDLESQNYVFLTFTSIFMLLLLLISYSIFHKAFAASPEFDQVLITDEQMSNQKNDWVQTYGNDSTHLRSDYANILAVDYLSDGKTLNATLWLKSNSENVLTYSQPFKKIRYGMLIAFASCLRLQDIMEPITTFILKQLMENGANIYTYYH